MGAWDDRTECLALRVTPDEYGAWDVLIGITLIQSQASITQVPYSYGVWRSRMYIVYMVCLVCIGV